MRISTDQPSSGKPIQLRLPTSVNGGFLDDTFTILAEAPDFTVPSTGDTGVTLDPLDPSRELRPGEVFFETPLYACNSDNDPATVILAIIPQDESDEVPLMTVVVPSNETVLIPIQGLRLIKTDFDAADGDRLVARVESSLDTDQITLHGSAAELMMADHAPDTEA